jgi:RNA polymerase-interacting CarD/CdnL/TRCF family regulator
MDKNYKARQTRIKEVFDNGSIQKMAMLLRDLLNLTKSKKLNDTEFNAVEKLIGRFEREYAICYDVPQNEASSALTDYIGEYNR